MPTLPTVNVTVNVVDASGDPVFGVAIVFRLNRLATVSGIAVPTNVVALTDAAGVAVVPLCPNALCGGSYAVRISAGGVDSRGVAVIPNEDCLLDSVFQSVPYPEPTYVEAALAEITGATASVTASTATATTAATTATTQAGLATTAAGIATSAAGTATSAADTATAKAAEASGFSDSAEGYSQDAEAARDTAVGAVASLNLPVLTVSDAGKYLQVDAEGDGYVASAVTTPVPTQITNAGFGVWSNGTLESAVSSVNLITNGEFETDTAGWAAGNSATLTRDTTTFQNGAACLKITNPASTLTAVASFPVQTVVGNVYKLVAYGARGTASISFASAGTTASVNAEYGFKSLTTTSLTRVELIFEATAVQSYINLFNVSESGVTGYFDSVTLYDMGAKISVTNITSGVCTCSAAHGLVVGRLVKFTNGSNAAVAAKLYEVTAVTDSTHFTLNDTSVNPGATSSTSCTEVTVGCVDYNTKALDLWAKDSAAVCFRETINTKAGSYYALRVYNGSVYWSDGGRAAKPEFYARYAGRAAAIGAWVRCSSANKARIGITDSAGTTWSNYHSGGGSYEWLEVTRTPGTGITSFNVVVDSGTGTEAQFSQPQLMFGTSIGSGNFVPILNEKFRFANLMSSKYGSWSGRSTTAMTLLSPRVDTLGMFPMGIKGLSVAIVMHDTSAANHYATVNGTGTTLGAFTGDRQVSVMTHVTNIPSPSQGAVQCDINGNIYVGHSASGTNTAYFTLQYTGVQL